MKRDVMSSGEAPTRPVLRYHGGKFRLAPWILSFFPDHVVYVEPFGGAGSILLQKKRVGAECYNDLDGNVVNLFRILLYDRELYPDWIRHERKHIADGGRVRKEVVWINPACAAALEQQASQQRMFA